MLTTHLAYTPPPPAIDIPALEREMTGIIETLSKAIAEAACERYPILPLELCRVVAGFCGPIDLAKEIYKVYRKNFVENIGAGRLARLPMATAATLGIESHLPWRPGKEFPLVAVDRMPAEAVRSHPSSETPFLAVRVFSNRVSAPRVEFIFQDNEGIGWGQTLFGYNTRMCIEPGDYERLRNFLDGSPIQGASVCADTYRFPSERFTLAPPRSWHGEDYGLSQGQLAEVQRNASEIIGGISKAVIAALSQGNCMKKLLYSHSDPQKL